MEEPDRFGEASLGEAQCSHPLDDPDMIEPDADPLDTDVGDVDLFVGDGDDEPDAADDQRRKPHRVMERLIRAEFQRRRPPSAPRTRSTASPRSARL